MKLNILFVTVIADQYFWTNKYIVHALALMGHIVFPFYYGSSIDHFVEFEKFSEQKKKNVELINTAKKLKDDVGLDLIFCYAHDDFLLPSCAKMLSDLRIPMVNYNVDMPIWWYRQIKTARYFDMMLCAQRHNMKNLARYSKKVFYFPMAALPFSSHATSVDMEKTHDVTFLGTATTYRKCLFSKLANTPISFSIFGQYWDPSHPGYTNSSLRKRLSDLAFYAWPRIRTEGAKIILKPITRWLHLNKKKNVDFYIPKEITKGSLKDEDVLKLFQTSKINIGLTRYAIDDPDQIGHCHIKLRDFEVPMSGGFYLVEKAPDYDQMFIDGKEIVTWQTFPELLEKIHYYLKHDDEREKIAAAGQKRAMRDHTWQIRLNELFKELGLPSD